MVFLHGWPGIGLIWRAQVEVLAARGWRCIAPDLRGYGGSSAPEDIESFAVQEIVHDMVELQDHLGNRPAIWIGHDLGSPIAGALAAHHPERCRGLVLVSVPYFPDGFAICNLLPLINRQIYPADLYPDGQWDYYRFYQTHFNQTVSDFEADIPATLAAIYRPGNPSAQNQVYRSALVTQNGGWFGATRLAPKIAPDPGLWPPGDFDALIASFRSAGFKAANAWYLNDDINTAYASAAAHGGRLTMPVLFVNGDYDGLFDVGRSRIGDPMATACSNLEITHHPAGHWLPLEYKAELSRDFATWASNKQLTQDG
jgi:pimeloyl-ACP methyl ester carboxylesterase